MLKRIVSTISPPHFDGNRSSSPSEGASGVARGGLAPSSEPTELPISKSAPKTTQALEWAPTLSDFALKFLGLSQPIQLAQDIRGFEKTGSLFTAASEAELAQWEGFLVALQQAACTTDPVSSAQEMREVFADHPEVFAWFLKKRSLVELVERYPALAEDPQYTVDCIKQIDSVGTKLWDAYRVWTIGSGVWSEASRAQELFSGISEHGVKDYCMPQDVASSVGSRLWDLGKSYATSTLKERALNCAIDRVENLTRKERLAVLAYVPDFVLLPLRGLAK